MIEYVAQLEVPRELDNRAGQGQLDDAVNIFIAIAAAVALLMIVWGGFKYVTSKGDPSATAKARGTIIYAAVGLAICILAFAIVQFVIGNV